MLAPLLAGVCPFLGERLEVLGGVLPSLPLAAAHFPSGFMLHFFQQELLPVFYMGGSGRGDREDGEDFI